MLRGTAKKKREECGEFPKDMGVFESRWRGAGRGYESGWGWGGGLESPVAWSWGFRGDHGQGGVRVPGGADGPRVRVGSSGDRKMERGLEAESRPGEAGEVRVAVRSCHEEPM